MKAISVTVHQNTCPVCGTGFWARTSTAKYCSSKCRQTAKRDRDQLWQRVKDIERMLEEIDRTSHPQKVQALWHISKLVRTKSLKLVQQPLLED